MAQEKKKNIVTKVFGDMADSARAVHEINKENMAAVKADSKANFVEATTPSPEFVEFKEAKGLKNKAKAVVKGMKASAHAASEKEKERREEIQNHTVYKELLEEQRENRQNTINNN